MEKTKKQELAKIAAEIRLDILEQVHAAKSGHPGGSLSIAEILAYLYYAEMRVDPANPKRMGVTVWCSPKVTPHRLFTPFWRKKDISRKRSCRNCGRSILSCKATRI